jgi:hypothetical protein
MLLGFHLYAAYPEAYKNSYENTNVSIPFINGDKKVTVWARYFWHSDARNREPRNILWIFGGANFLNKANLEN